MSDTEQRSTAEEARGHIVVVTGSSHSGKSSLILAMMSRSSRCTAHVAIDDVIEQIDLEHEDRWEHGLDLAYDEALGRVGRLAKQGALVFFESTFTYVPPDQRPPELHLAVLERLTKVASDAGADFTLVQLRAELADVLRRREESDRLAARIVRTTWHLHADNDLARLEALRVDTSEVSVDEAADELCRVLGC
jgi:chloramphenicol 3-O-phosphotransferase